MELQTFTIIGGDGDLFREGDYITIEGVYDLTSMTRRERSRHRLNAWSRWFKHLPGNLRWSLYLRAVRVADWLDPDRGYCDE